MRFSHLAKEAPPVRRFGLLEHFWYIYYNIDVTPISLRVCLSRIRRAQAPQALKASRRCPLRAGHALELNLRGF